MLGVEAAFGYRDPSPGSRIPRIGLEHILCSSAAQEHTCNSSPLVQQGTSERRLVLTGTLYGHGIRSAGADSLDSDSLPPQISGRNINRRRGVAKKSISRTALSTPKCHDGLFGGIHSAAAVPRFLSAIYPFCGSTQIIPARRSF